MLPVLPLLLLASSALQADAAPTAFPHDQVLNLEIGADDPRLVEGRGPTIIHEFETDFSGSVHLWTTSALDLFLQVDDAGRGTVMGQDDDSGGGTTPYLSFAVEAGDYLAIIIAAKTDGDAGPLNLHMAVTPERDFGIAMRGAEVRDLFRAGDVAAARGLAREQIESVLSISPAKRSESLMALLPGLAILAAEVGEHSSVIEARRAERDYRARTLPELHAVRIASQLNLAVALHNSGQFAKAEELYRGVVESYGRLLPDDHLDLARARLNLAFTLEEQGKIKASHELLLDVVAVRERALPDDHPDVLAARTALGSSLLTLGDYAGARNVFEQNLAVSERFLPQHDIRLLGARMSLANALMQLGNLTAAQELFELGLSAVIDHYPADDFTILSARSNLAQAKAQLGDLMGARTIQEFVLPIFERDYPANHPNVLRAKENLALSVLGMGDYTSARILLESVLVAHERQLPEGHPEILTARAALGMALSRAGDYASARVLEESVLSSRERQLPAGHRSLLMARLNLAVTKRNEGDLDGAREDFEAAVAGFESILPKSHPHLVGARLNVAELLMLTNRVAEAREMLESIVAEFERTKAESYDPLLDARLLLAAVMLKAGDLDGARALVPVQLEGMRARVLSSLALSPRQASEVVATETSRLGAIFTLTDQAPDLLDPVFELQETMRMVVGEAARALRASEDPEIQSLILEATRARAALGELLVSDATGDPETLAAELTRLTQERDRLEREASRLLAAQGVVTRPIDLDAIARTLPDDAALLGYRRHVRAKLNEVTGVFDEVDHLAAHVMRPDGSTVRVVLGRAEEIEKLALEWRRSLGRPVLARGVAMGVEVAADDPRASGIALRERLIDPILAQLPSEANTLHICADDFLFLVPIDALPLDDGHLGDRYRVVNEVSFARFLAPAEATSGASGLLAIGGVDYNAGREGGTGGETDGTRGALPGQFEGLAHARLEVETTGRLFEKLVQVEPVVLGGADATTEALFQHAPGKRFLHLATHGWFAPEVSPSAVDVSPGVHGWVSIGVQERVTGMAPMLLCGLALAGANQGVDTLGRRPGILTAEELCSLDLSACDLAVLSACETNVGVRRAGQGVQSLQAALYAAGAKSSITSLWQVDDAATRRLMEIFYTNVWEAGMSKSTALWEAKTRLRSEGHPLRNWAGWVLTGAPD